MILSIKVLADDNISISSRNHHQSLDLSAYSSTSKYVFITAMFGTYEKSAKKVHPQNVPTDWICFTNNPNLEPNGWQLDYFPYHDVFPSPIDDGKMLNSFNNNKHPFNKAKYYKQAFQNIPRLKQYDIVIWLDGTLEIECDFAVEYVANKIINQSQPVVGWHHEMRHGSLKQEVDVSIIESPVNKYVNTEWLGFKQPRQNVKKQYEDYLASGYREEYWNEVRSKVNNTSPHFGVWITAFVAFDNKNGAVTNFLNYWYLQTLQYSTQDQVGFSFAAQRLNIIPYTLPDDKIWGGKPHEMTQFYWKWNHGARY